MWNPFRVKFQSQSKKWLYNVVGEGLDHVPRLFVLSLVHYISRKTFRMLMRDECVFESEKKGDSTRIEPKSPWRECGMVTTRPLGHVCKLYWEMSFKTNHSQIPAITPITLKTPCFLLPPAVNYIILRAAKKRFFSKFSGFQSTESPIYENRWSGTWI